MGPVRTFLAAASFALAACSQRAGPDFAPRAGVSATLYVSVDGDDGWSGATPFSNSQRTDGPLRTLEGARDALRRLRTQGRLNGDADVRILPGYHARAAPFVLEPRDSGAAGARVHYVGFGEKPAVVGGGVRLRGFAVRSDGVWTVTIPEVARGEWRFSQLYVGGRRRPRPRLPRDGYAAIAGAAASTEAAAERGFDRFHYAADDLHEDWHRVEDVEILAFHNWSMSRMRIAALDPTSRLATLTGPTCAKQSWADLHKGGRYLVENVREALRARGEWYLDRVTGELTYLSFTDEDPNETEVIAPCAESLVELRGDPSARDFVERVSFEGIAFAHTAWNVPAGGYSCPQAEVALPAAITARGARDCQLSRCTISHTGAWALELGGGSQRNEVTECELLDLGAGGIKIGEALIRDDAEAVACRNSVHHNWILGAGRTHPAAVAVWIGQSHGNAIEHNEIHDLYYTGISVGWTWGYGPSLAHHNSILANHIARVGQGVLSDMGGIYTLGVSPGTVVRGNKVVDVECHDYGGWGLYADEGSTGILFEGNSVILTTSGGFHQHYGKENVVRRNAFYFGRDSQVVRTRAESHLSFTFEDNVVGWSEGELLHGNFDGEGIRFDRNGYRGPNIRAYSFAGRSREEWQRMGRDLHSTFGDATDSRPDPESADAGWARGGNALQKQLAAVPETFSRGGGR